ncbi:hypothetical protein KOI35_26680 [Actinoplanes bogorensis]|uniref:DUF3558 domain-containing protein n=1 Tax=Paractinoplanes bogorensis TaxID=1610840 RepID=A0ABS5YWJ0_9ACTN|nr:hypothetical protein [Actinoplanes bogorensis]MBU2667098.1 hypothetical protein [Actinoplanes bogorensis]
MRGKSFAWAAILLVGGCGQATTATPGAAGDSSPPPSPAAAWNSVAGGCPALTGRKQITDGPFGNANGFDDATSYTVSCAYGDTGPVPELFITIEIDRAHPTRRDWTEKTNTAKQAAGSAGHIAIELPGVGDGGIAIADRTKPTVLAAAWSANAYISTNVTLAGPVRDQVGLTGEADQLRGVLQETLDNLRP